jgi:hypothetical protein
VRPAIRQRAQRRWLARGAGASGHPLPGDREAPVIRGDAAFANPEIYEFLEAEGIGYTIRLPANTVLQNRIGHLLKRPIGRPPHEARRYFASFSYQAQSWKKSRRVVAKVEWHPNELYPRVGFIVTNLARPAEHVVAFYNQRGTAEQWIKEGKGAIKCTRLSCRTFAANAVRLQLHALAYNLGYFMRTLALPETTEPWSLISLREKLIKIGEGCQPRSLRHFPAGRGVGVATDVRGNPVADRSAPGTTRASMRGAGSDLRQARAAEEVRLDAGKSARLPPRRSRAAAFDRLLQRDARFTVVETPRKGNPGQPTARNRRNVS